MSARKAGNGFVGGQNCFVAGGPTKQFAGNLNDFRSERQNGTGLRRRPRHRPAAAPGIESPPLTSVVHWASSARSLADRRHQVGRLLNLSLVEKRFGLLDGREPKRPCGRLKLIACNFSVQLRVVM
jgi:hypothetical protein